MALYKSTLTVWGFHSVTGQKRALLAQQTPRTLLSGGRLKDLLPHARSTRPTVSFLGICLTPGESPLAARCRDLYAPSTMTHSPFPYRTPCPPLPQRTGGPSERERGSTPPDTLFLATQSVSWYAVRTWNRGSLDKRVGAIV